MNAVLPKNLEEFVRQQVETGRYQNASEVVQDALERLEREVQKSPEGVSSSQDLAACYASETKSEREWENRTAEASSLKAEAF